jgi:HAD superfamily hydrolase (TIGR01509 family)
MPRDIRLVIFDCDGVLVDSEVLAVRVVSELLTEAGWPLGPDEVAQRFVGLSTGDMMAHIADHFGGHMPANFGALHAERFESAVRSELTPVPGIVDALDALDLPTCVASSGSHARMRLTLGVTGLYERFAGRIYSASEVAEGKPAPDLFLHAAAGMGVAPEHCVVVEDSRFGVEAARRAGMVALGFAGGLTEPAALEGPETVVFTDMARLPALISELVG